MHSSIMRIFVAALACMLLLPSAAFAIRINEIMYNPAANNYYAEWIEVWNDGSNTVDMTGWRLCGSPLVAGYMDHKDKYNKITHDSGMSLPANGYAIITDGVTGSTVLDNFTVDVNAMLLHVDAAAMCNKWLDNPGDIVTLTGNNGVVDNVTYTDIAKVNYSIERDSTGWLQSLVNGGTPGYVNSILQQGPPPNPPAGCQPDWQCSNWNDCTDGYQGRTCTDQNKCGTAAGEPIIIQTCNPVTTPSVTYANKITISLIDAPAQAVAGSRLELNVRLFNDFPTVKDVIVSAFLAGQNPSDGYTYVLEPKQSKTVLVPLEIGKDTGPNMLFARVSDGNFSSTTKSPLTITAPATANTTVTHSTESSGPSGAFALNIDLSMFGQLFGDFWSWITGFFSSHELPRSLSN